MSPTFPCFFPVYPLRTPTTEVQGSHSRNLRKTCREAHDHPLCPGLFDPLSQSDVTSKTLGFSPGFPKENPSYLLSRTVRKRTECEQVDTGPKEGLYDETLSGGSVEGRRHLLKMLCPTWKPVRVEGIRWVPRHEVMKTGLG